jgi:hypothetical protein
MEGFITELEDILIIMTALTHHESREIFKVVLGIV